MRFLVRLVVAVTLAVAWGGCGDSDDGGASGEFVALTYNVAGLPEGISSSHPAVNTAQIGPLLNDYDFVLMQETWETPDPNPLAPLRTYHEILEAASTHPYRSVPLPAPLNQDPERPTAIVSDGLNRFSEFPFAPVTRQRWFGCDDTDADCLSLKGFSFARTRLSDGVCVDVYNLHNEAGNSDHDKELKAMNMRDLAAFMNTMSAGRAIILGGDFNMRLRREADAANFEYLTSATGLSDACIDVGVFDDDEIDKFFYRSNDRVTITPVSCTFPTDKFSDANGEPLSDHDPLAVGFSWQAKPDRTDDCF